MIVCISPGRQDVWLVGASSVFQSEENKMRKNKMSSLSSCHLGVLLWMIILLMLPNIIKNMVNFVSLPRGQLTCNNHCLA